MKRTFKELTTEFLENLDIRENSRSLYKRNLKQFAKWVVYTGKEIKALKRTDIIEYKAWLIRSHKAEYTIDSYLTIVRLFYAWLEDIGEHENIAAGIKVKHKHIGYRKEHLNDEEIEKLYTVINTNTITGKRNYAIINLMLRVGLRCIEVSRLRICDITTSKKGSSLLLHRKGDIAPSERIGITLKTLEPILDYLNYRGVKDKEEYVFTSHCSIGEHQLTSQGVGYIVASYMKQAGIHSKTKTPHSLRHTAAVKAILRKAPIKEVQLMLGHKRVDTTEIYLKSADNELRMCNTAILALDDAF